MERKQVTTQKAFDLELWTKLSLYFNNYQVHNITKIDSGFLLSHRHYLYDSKVSSDTILEYSPLQLLWSDEPIDRTQGHKGLQEMFLEITGRNFKPSDAISLEEYPPDITYDFGDYVVDCCPDGDYIFFRISSLNHLHPYSK